MLCVSTTHSGARPICRACDRTTTRVLAALVLLATTAWSQQVSKLNDPLLRIVGGDVAFPEPTPDWSRFVFLADREMDDRLDLYSVPADGSAAPIRLSTHTSGFALDFHVSADSTKVVYRYRETLTSPAKLLQVPIDGSAPPVQLQGLAATSDTLEYQIDRAGEHVVYLADELVKDKFELFSVPSDGSGSPVKLSGNLPSFSDVVSGFVISPQGERVVFLADTVQDDIDHLFSAPVAGGVPPTEIDDPRNMVLEFRIAPSSLTVGYLAFPTTASIALDAFSASITGGSLHLLSQSVPALQGAFPAPDWFTADSARMLFFDGRQLYSAPTDGSTPAVSLSNITLPGGIVQYDFALDPDGKRAVYAADALTDDEFELFSVPVDGSAPPVRLNAPLPSSGDVIAYKIDPRCQRVAFLVNPGAGKFQLFSAPLAGGRPPVRIDNLASPDRTVGAFKFHPEGERVFYTADLDQAGLFELYSVPAGGGTSVKISGPISTPVGFAALHPSIDFWVGPEPAQPKTRRSPSGERPLVGRVVYQLDPERSEVFELFSVPVEGGAAPVRLSPPFGFNATVGDVRSFATSATRAVYRADQDTDDRVELYSRPLDGSAPSVKLSPPLAFHGNVSSVAVDPAGTRAVFLANLDISGIDELFSAPIDGSSPAVRLHPPLIQGQNVSQYWITPDSQRVLMRGDLEYIDRLELYSAPLDGSAPAVKLHPQLGSLVMPWVRITPDSSRVVFLIGNGLYCAPVDGSGPLVRLDPSTGSLFIDTVEDSFLLSPDGTRVVFRASGGSSGIYSAPIDGSAPALRISAVPVSFGGIPYTIGTGLPFQITADSTRVVYVSAQTTAGVDELYVAPIDGSASPTHLNAPLPPQGDVTGIAVSPQNDRVLFLADSSTNEKFELLSVPIDGSAAPVTISGTLASTADVQTDFAFSPDGTRAFFRIARLGETNLWSAPTDGSAAPVALSAAFLGSKIVKSFRALPDGSEVVFFLDGASPCLFRSPADGSSPQVPVHTPAFNNLTDYELAPDGVGVVFIGDLDEPKTQELYLSTP